MFYINFLFITQSLIEVAVLLAMLFKNFDKFSSVLHFSTLKLLLFSCRKSLRFLSAHILKLCVFSQTCAWKTQNADQKLSLNIVIYYSYDILSNSRPAWTASSFTLALRFKWLHLIIRQLSLDPISKPHNETVTYKCIKVMY